MYFVDKEFKTVVIPVIFFCIAINVSIIKNLKNLNSHLNGSLYVYPVNSFAKNENKLNIQNLFSYLRH